MKFLLATLKVEEQAIYMTLGTRVVRGRDWRSGNEDKNDEGTTVEGTIVDELWDFYGGWLYRDMYCTVEIFPQILLRSHGRMLHM